jgi:hypothetical protein
LLEQKETKETKNGQLRLLRLLLLRQPSWVGAGQAQAVEAVCRQESQLLMADVQPRITQIARVILLRFEL